MVAKSKKIIQIGSLCLAVAAMSGWSLRDTLIIAWATSRHPKIPKYAVELAEPARTDFKRQEQKYFLDYGIYVPLEDMMYSDQLSHGAERYSVALRKACSGMRADAGFAIWLPLKTRWPVIGERVMEWCWKPPIQRQETAG